MEAFLAVISIMTGVIELQGPPMSYEDCRADLAATMEIIRLDADPTNDALCATPAYLDGMAAAGWEVNRLD